MSGRQTGGRGDAPRVSARSISKRTTLHSSSAAAACLAAAKGVAETPAVLMRRAVVAVVAVFLQEAEGKKETKRPQRCSLSFSRRRCWAPDFLHKDNHYSRSFRTYPSQIPVTGCPRPQQAAARRQKRCPCPAPPPLRARAVPPRNACCSMHSVPHDSGARGTLTHRTPRH